MVVLVLAEAVGLGVLLCKVIEGVLRLPLGEAL